jgi:hypothetical protein
MPDVTVSPTVQTLTVTPTVQSLTVATAPALIVDIDSWPLTVTADVIASNITLANATTWYTVKTFALGAGQWLVLGNVVAYSTSGTPTVDIRVVEPLLGTVYGSSASAITRATAALSVNLSTVVQLSAPSTNISLEAATTVGGSVTQIRAATPSQSAPYCTNLIAIRIA